MKLVIVRHGTAEQDSPTGLDQDRRLAALGERQALWLGKSLLSEGFGDAAVFASRAARAQTTARLLCQELGCSFREDDALFLGVPTPNAMGLIESNRNLPMLIVVGHNPPMSELASILVTGFGRCTIGLDTGSAAVLEVAGDLEPGTAELVKILRFEE